MKLVLTIICAAFCLAEISAVPARIENGVAATGKPYSVIVLALARVGAHRAAFGGGFIISRRHILTTAHLCVNAKQFRVGYGDLRSHELIRVTANSALIHSHFNPDTLENDIAIILLPNGQTFTTNVISTVAISRRVIEPGLEGVVAGFGFNSDNSNTISEDLLEARQVIVKNDACVDAFSRDVHRNQFCAQDQAVPQPPHEENDESEEGDSDNTGGDSDNTGGDSDNTGGDSDNTGGDSDNTGGDSDNTGGDSDNTGGDSDNTGGDNTDDGRNPFFPDFNWSRSLIRNGKNNLAAVCRGDTGNALVRHVSNVFVAYGIVSRVPQGCNSHEPALYTRLSSFVQWIEDATLGEVQTTNE